MSESANAQQIEFWNGPAGQRWAVEQETMDRNMSAITAALMPFAGARAGERVLDIGCGSGTTTFLLAEAAGAKGSVTGVDISAPMLGVARARVAKSGSKAQFVEADASARAFTPEFDLVFSRFGVMFFADPAAAFINIRRGLVPGGRMRFVCWRSLAENPWAAVPLMAALPLLPPQPPPDPTAPGPFAFADAERLKTILTHAGFRDVRAQALDTAMRIGGTLEEAAKFMLTIGPLARAAAEVDEATREKIRARVSEALKPYATPSGVAAPAACWLVGATV